MNAIFRSPQWRFENPTFNANEFGIGTSPGALLRLPFRFALNSEKFGEGLPRGGAGIGLLLAFPFALIFLFRGRPAQRIVLAVTAVHIVAWTLTFQYARYMTPVLPFLAIIGCAVFLDDSTGRRRLNRVLLGCCVFAQLAIAPVLFWNIPERFPLSRALGLESEEDFLSRALLGYRSARALNSMLQPQDKILGANVESLRFYLKGPLYTMAESRIILDKIETARDLAVWQTEHGFKYVLAPQTDVQHPAPYFLFLRPPFLKEFGTLRYSDEEAAVFEVSPPDPTPRSPSPDEPAVDRVVVDPPVVRLNQSYTARFVGRNLTEGVYFDVRVRSPGSAKETTVLNWQQGTSAPHNVPAGMEPGDWIITAVRAHLDPDDRRAAFAPVSAKIRVVSK
jgi:hypothetical protein